MAGDWIKMRTNLDTDPRIIEIAECLGIPELQVVGCLWKVWAWADQHTLDGNAIRVTSVTLDRFTHVTGFADALRKVGWLDGRDTSLSFPRFAEHNGQTAKKRAETKERVAKHRNTICVTDVTPKALPEKRREEKSLEVSKDTSSANRGLAYSDEFESFWEAFPKQRRTKKGDAYRKWKLAVKRVRPDVLIQRAAEYAQSERGRSEYAVMPSVWLNGGMWEDEPEAWQASGNAGSEYKKPSERKQDPKLQFELKRTAIVKRARDEGWDDDRLRAAIERIRTPEVLA